jgi:hypothetical protein
MPWKTTKLKFFGVPVRRRTLHVLTLFFAIAAVPAASWAVLNSGNEVPQLLRMKFEAGAALAIGAALLGWWTIVRNHVVLYYEEARFIWPSAVLLVVLATWLGWKVADLSFQRGRLNYVVPLTLGGMVLLFLVVRWALLGRHPKKSDIVRGGGPARPRRHHSLPVANVLMEELAKAKKLQKGSSPEEKDSDEEPPADDFED